MSERADSDNYVDSLDRLIGVLRGQIALARAVNAKNVAVDVADLERMLNILEGDGKHLFECEDCGSAAWCGCTSGEDCPDQCKDCAAAAPTNVKGV